MKHSDEGRKINNRIYQFLKIMMKKKKLIWTDLDVFIRNELFNLH